MAVLRQIAQLGHPILRAVASPVELPVSAGVSALVEDMLATLRDADGVGIAAPQVHESLAIFLVASRPNPRYPDAPAMEPEVVINPEIVDRSDELVPGWEGCLSIPGLRGLVPRHRWMRVRYRTPEEAEVEREFADFVARIFQHEDDHLRGVVFLDRLASTRDVVTEREFRQADPRSSAESGTAQPQGKGDRPQAGLGGVGPGHEDDRSRGACEDAAELALGCVHKGLDGQVRREQVGEEQGVGRADDVADDPLLLAGVGGVREVEGQRAPNGRAGGQFAPGIATLELGRVAGLGHRWVDGFGRRHDRDARPLRTESGGEAREVFEQVGFLVEGRAVR